MGGGFNQPEETSPAATSPAAFTVSMAAALDTESRGRFIYPVTPKTEAEVEAGWIMISTREELENIKNNLSGNYILMNNIDLAGKEWMPIGTEATPFTGTLDGNGYVISNMTITQGVNVGLFGYLGSENILGELNTGTGGSINNLGLEDTNISITGTAASVGAFAAISGNASLGNCYNTGTVNAPTANAVGGLIGKSSDGTKGNQNIQFFRAYNEADVTGVNCGGLLGRWGNLTDGSINFGDSFNCGNIKGTETGGGLAGGVCEADYVPFFNMGGCYNSGDVEANAAAGLFSWDTDKVILINYCYNTGTISGGKSGGLLFKARGVRVQNSYNAGDCDYSFVAEPTITDQWNWSDEYELTNCYYKSEASANPETKATALTDMTDKDLFASFDFVNIWGIGPSINNGMPYLRPLEGSYAWIEDDGEEQSGPTLLDFGGTVTDADTALPVGEVTVHITSWKTDGEAHEVNLLTGADGKFATQIYAGKVSVSTTREGYANWTNADIADVEYSANKTDFDMQLTPDSTVAGVTITTASLPSGKVGKPYSAALTADSELPVTYGVTAGSLPSGLSVSGDTIAGTPEAGGVYTFTVEARSDYGSGSKEFTITVEEALTITTTTLPKLTAGVPATLPLTARGGADIIWSLSGTLPEGMALSSDGIISGTPTEDGEFTFNVKAEADGDSAEKTLVLTVGRAPEVIIPEIITAELPNGQLGKAYSAIIGAIDATEPFTVWEGTLPDGLTLSDSGIISGTPTKVGEFSFKVQSGSGSAYFMKEFTIVITETAPPSGAYLTESDVIVFPDSKFEEAVMEVLGLEKPAYYGIYLPRAQEITELDLRDKGITDLAGIEFFTNLKSLDCGENMISTLDLSKNTKLTRLLCDRNQITALDVSASGGLAELEAYGNNLKNIDLTHNMALINLLLSENDLTAIDLTKNRALQVARISYNDIAGIDLSGNAGLLVIEMNYNRLGRIDVSANAKLLSVSCQGNSIKALDVSRNAALQGIDCGENYIAALDLSNNPELRVLSCDDNLLTGIDLTQNPLVNTLEVQNNYIASESALLGLGELDTENMYYKFYPQYVTAPYIVTENLPTLAYMNTPYEGRFSVVGDNLNGGTGTAVTWSLAGGALPDGLTLTNGKTVLNSGADMYLHSVISGTPTKKGVFTFTLRAENAAGYDTKQFTVEIEDPTNLPHSVTTYYLKGGRIGVPYEARIGVEGQEPFTYSMVGTLPPGISFTEDGYFRGVPTEPGIYTGIRVKVSNALGSVNVPFTASITGAPTILSDPMPVAVAGLPYSAEIPLAGTQPISLTVPPDALPEGLSLAGNRIVGTPTEIGVFNVFPAYATNAEGFFEGSFTLTVDPLAITTTSLPMGKAGAEYSAQMEALSALPVTWMVRILSLPDGLTMSADGKITGIPLNMEKLSFWVEAKNDYGTKDINLSIDVGQQPTNIYVDLLMDYMTDEECMIGLEAEGSTPIVWSIAKGTLPEGLSISSDGIMPGRGFISGTPTKIGVYNVTVKAENGAGSATQEISIVVRSNTAIQTDSLPGGKEFYAYAATLQAAGRPPIEWILTEGELPPGLTLSTDGKISGTPTKAGAYSFTLGIDDLRGSDSKEYSITIAEMLAPKITTQFPERFITGQSYQVQFEAEGDAPMTWIMNNGEPPQGVYWSLEMTSAGRLRGILPARPGIYPFKVKAENAKGADEKVLLMQVYPLEEGKSGAYINEQGYIVFPDPNFKAALLAAGVGRNGEITPEQASGDIPVSDLNLAGKNIVSLEGIEFFTQLVNLDVSRNNIAEMNLEANTELVGLSCASNKLAALDLSKNVALERLSCENNLLTELNVSSAPLLVSLRCDGNRLSTLNTKANKSLGVLWCYSNRLTALDLSGNPQLVNLMCDRNKLTALNVSRNPALTQISCGNNLLTALDVSGNTKLEYLSCRYNYMTSEVKVTGLDRYRLDANGMYLLKTFSFEPQYTSGSSSGGSSSGGSSSNGSSSGGSSSLSPSSPAVTEVAVPKAEVMQEDQANETAAGVSEAVAKLSGGSASVSSSATVVSGVTEPVRLEVPIDANAGVSTMALLMPDNTLQPVPTFVDPLTGKVTVIARADGVYVPVSVEASFNDVNAGDWYGEAVKNAAELLLVQGDGDGTYRPNDTITTAEVVKMLQNVIGLPEDLSVSSEAEWYAGVMLAAESAGITNADTEPEAPGSRAEAAEMMAAALEVLGIDTSLTEEDMRKAKEIFTDIEALTTEQQEAFALCYKYGIFSGYGDGTVRPFGTLTRAEMAVLALKLREVVEL